MTSTINNIHRFSHLDWVDLYFQLDYRARRSDFAGRRPTYRMAFEWLIHCYYGSFKVKSLYQLTLWCKHVYAF